MKARRLKQIADWINANGVALGLRAVVERTQVSTDTKIPGTRLSRHGKGRWGNRIRIYKRSGPVPIHEHNAAYSWARNEDLERWLAEWIARLPEVRRAKLKIAP